MKKKINLPWILAIILLCCAFNTIFFMNIPIVKTPAMWACYGFIIIAFICNLVTPLFVLNDRREVLSLSLYFVSFVYLIIAIVLSYEMIYCYPIAEGFVYLSHIGVLCIYLILFFICLFLNKKTNRSLENDEKEIKFIKENVTKLKNFSLSINDKETLKAIESLISLLHSSSKKTNSNVYDLENEITTKIDELVKNDVVDISNRIDDIKNCIKKRNNILTSSN